MKSTTSDNRTAENLTQNKKSPGIVRTLLQKRESAIVIPAFILFFIFSVTTDSFLTAYNIFNISRNLAFNVFIALGQAVVLAIGGMNLSVGAIGGLATITCGHMIMNMGLPGWAAIAAALLVGVLSGAVNGLAITKLKLNSFIVTLSTSFIFTGLVYGISKGYAYTEIPKTFTYVGRKAFLFFPVVFWVMVVTLIVIHYVYHHTVTGRRLLATGGNLDAARLSGINTDKMLVIANMLSGFFAAMTGVLYVSRMGSAQPATGQNWMVISFAVSIIGGTALTGGVITSVGLFAGGVIMVLIKNGLILLEANVYFEQAFLGAIILLTVSLDRIKGIIGDSIKNKRKRGRK